jgi:hypothetical protein
VYPAVVAESARWGDRRRDVNPGAYTPADFDLFHRDKHYDPYQDWVIGIYFPQRRDIYLDQLRARGLWLDTLAPVFSSYGGPIPSGFSLSMSNGNSSGTVYYTLDGSDPREAFSSSPVGMVYTSSLTLTNNNTTLVKARVLRANAEWSPLSEAAFEIDPDDTDLDGLSDGWEYLFFTNLSQNAEDDFDGDGHSNAEEEFVGTHPLDAASVFMAVPQHPEGGVMTLQVTPTSRSIRLEVSTDLQSWVAVETFTVFPDRIEVTLDSSTLRRYFRVVAE